MSDIQFRLELEVERTHLHLWQVLLQGLCDGELGAYLEERIEPFGPEAERLLDPLLDDCLSFDRAPSFGNLHQSGSHFSVTIYGGHGLGGDVAQLVELFRCCGATVVANDRSLFDPD